MLAITIVATKSAITLPTLEKLSHPAISQQAVLGAAIAGFSFLLFLFLLFQLLRRKAAPSMSKHKPEQQPELHIHIKELQRALVKEMQSTARQNNLMIILTMVFILVSLFSGAILVLLSHVPNFFGDLFSFLKSFLGR